MKVLMWMDGSFDRRTPSEHLLVAIVQALYANGHTVHIIQQNTGGPLDVLPKELVDLGVTTDCVPCQMAAKGNLAGRYLAGLGYIWRCRKAIWKHRDCEAVFNQSSNAAGVMAFMVKRLLPKARLTYNVQDIFPEMQKLLRQEHLHWHWELQSRICRRELLYPCRFVQRA